MAMIKSRVWGDRSRHVHFVWWEIREEGRGTSGVTREEGLRW